MALGRDGKQDTPDDDVDESDREDTEKWDETNSPLSILPLYVEASNGSRIRESLQPTKESIDHHSTEDTPQGAHQNVERIMDAQIDAAVTCETSVQEQQRTYHLIAEEEHKEDTHPKGVGGVTGDESIKPAAIAVHQVYHLGEFRFLRRPQTVEVGLAKAAGELVAERHKQSDHDNDEQTVAPGVVLDDGIKQTGKQGNPRGCLGNGHHDTVEEERGRTIQGNE